MLFYNTVVLGGSLEFFSGAALLALSGLAYLIGRWSESHFQEMAAAPLSVGTLIMALVFLAPTAGSIPLPGIVAAWILLLASLSMIFYYDIRGRAIEKAGLKIRSDWSRSIREAAAQQERNRMAQELHDSVKQEIFAIQTNLATAQARWGAEPEVVEDAIARARTSARDAMAEITAMLDQLQTSPVETVGLQEAIRRQCEALRYRTGAAVETEFSELPPLEPEVQTAVYRVAQEALANVGRHSRAKQVRVWLGDPNQSGRAMLRILDDGQGFDPTCPSSGMGLANMKARARDIGGDVAIVSRPAGGCEVRLEVAPCQLETSRLKRYRHLFLVNLGLGVLYMLNGWGGWTAFWIPLGLVFLAATAYFGRNYLLLRNRLRKAS